MVLQGFPVLARPSAGARTAGAIVGQARPVPDGLGRQVVLTSALTDKLAGAAALAPLFLDGRDRQQELMSAVADRARAPRPPPPKPAGPAAPASKAPAAWPTTGVITGPFGEARGDGTTHPGLDIGAPVGQAVKAAAAGRVVVAGPAPAGYGGYGTLVIVDAGKGVQMLYAHLSAVNVTPGQAVKVGDLLGAVGMTGSTTGPHLHFEVRTGGVAVDPVAYLPRR
jgi:murein DD-endopeptidase MepM/ murein hydrolase activator NlpD